MRSTMTIARIHLQDGELWFGRDIQCARKLRLDVAGFAKSDKLDDVTDVYIVGFQQNSPLIATLYERYRNSAVRLWLGTPMPFLMSNLSQAAEILDNLGPLQSLPASLGGWHLCDDVDFHTARLRCALMEYSDLQWTSDLMFSHPLYRPLSFIESVDVDSLARLIAIIGDPRWFVDTQKPNRLNKLKAFLGLKFVHVEKSRANADVADLVDSSRGLQRCWYAVRSWTSGRSLEETDTLSPGNFLWHKALHLEERPHMGVYKSTRSFVSFLVGVWLDMVSREELFVPRYFFENCYNTEFDTKRTVEAFKTHLMVK